jgi:opacity protein-like surface antigen
MVRNQNLCCATSRSGTPPTRIGGHYETDMPGYTVGGAVGARFLEFLRGEINLSWRESDVDRMPLNGGPSPASGDVGLFAAMANVYGDLDLDDWVVIPYAGVGIGYGLIVLDAESDAKGIPRANHIDAKQSVFAWNVMAGVTYPYTEITTFTFGYRYIATTDPKFKDRIEGVEPSTTANPNGRGTRFLDSEYDAHELMLGVRFNF